MTTFGGPSPEDQQAGGLMVGGRGDDENKPLASPFTGGLGGEDSAAAASPQRSRLISGALVLALVLMIAGGALFMMRKFALTGGLRFVDVKIDYPMDGGARVTDEKHLRIMRDLSASDEVVQVPLKDLARNPFVLGGSEEAEALPDPTFDAVDPEWAKREQRRRDIENTLSALQLNGVITGAQPIARISGRAYRVGDVVADLFVLTAIHGRDVELQADGKTYHISLGQ